ncbi:MAG: NifB/NifX family molybdenum-iron cluster-binding protein [Bacteroidota bacterium]|nr:NifB/NifX family molybdenum-iron cluster-binding protein [Bacteroidota bacterium]
MKALRLCIGTNNEIHIANTHMGDTKKFCIFEINEKGESHFIETRKNTVKDMDHAKADKMSAILEIVTDVNILIAAEKSPNFVKIANTTSYQPIVIKTQAIKDALIIVSKNWTEITKLVTKRQAEVYSVEIPVFID